MILWSHLHIERDAKETRGRESRARFQRVFQWRPHSSSHSRLLIMAETLEAAIPSADAICSRRSVLRR